MEAKIKTPIMEGGGFVPVTKECGKCHRTLPIDNFGVSKTAKDGRRGWCKECMNAAAKEYNAKKKVAKGAIPNPALSDFTPQELITELRARGYEGQLTYTEVKVHKIKL